MRSPRSAAMSLVEVVFALGVLALVVSAVFATYGVAHNAGTISSEHQAASNAALRQLDTILSTPEIDDILRDTDYDANWVNLNPVEAYAFDAPINGSNLRPAGAAFHPLNTGPMATRAGHVTVVEDLDGDGAPDDYDGDGRADIVEVRVTVAWRSQGASGPSPFFRVDVTARRSR